MQNLKKYYVVKLRYIFIVLTLVLCGCADATPVLLKDAIMAPVDRVLAFQSSDISKTATLTVIRDTGYSGGQCFYALWINQTLAARLDVAEFATFHLEPGEILLRVGRDPQGNLLCGQGQHIWTQRETIMRAGEEKTFRMTIGANAMPDIMRSDIQ